MRNEAANLHHPTEPEADDAKARRLALEAKLIEEAREDLRAGRGLSGPELDAWLERFARGDQDLSADDGTPA